MRVIKEQKGSMAVYVSIVLISMLFILLAVFISSNAVLKSQMETTVGIKQSYELDNNRASEIYDSVINKEEEKYVFVEEFNTLPTYDSSNTDMSVENGIITLTATGIDPMIFMYNVTSFNPNEYRYIDVRYRVISGNDMMEFFMIENPSDQTYSCGASLESDGQWHVLTIDLMNYPNIINRGTITGWRWDWVGDQTTSIQVDYIRIRK